MHFKVNRINVLRIPISFEHKKVYFEEVANIHRFPDISH